MHEEVVKEYSKLSDHEQLDKYTLMAYCDSLYELGDDLSALENYLRFVKFYPSEKATNFPLFGAAMSLKNLDMQCEAKYLLKKISAQHNGLDKELLHSKEALQRQRTAREILEKFCVYDNEK